MLEFLIVRTDGDWFDIPKNADVYRPISIPYRKIDGWGNARIEIDGCEISFSYEIAGIQVSFNGPGLIDEIKATQITEEVLQNIAQYTGQDGEVIQISS